MGKRGKGQKGGNRNPKKRSKADRYEDPQDMDDDIDAFHKQRDVVPLDVNADAGDDSEEDDLEPVFDDEDIDEDDDDEDEDDEENGLAAKIAKQQKYLQAKFGGVDDDMAEEEGEEEKRLGWGGKKRWYHGGDNRDFELKSSDDEAPKEEEEEILRLQREKAKSLSMEDFGLDDVDEENSDRELTLEEIPVKGKERVKPSLKEAVVDDLGANFEVRKDLNALSREEQMDVVYSSAPELVGLLSELNVAVEELESKLNPLLSKVKVNGVKLEGGIRYLEVKQLLLLAYCQAITFYLLLKSEGHSVRDHPVIAHLVEIKGLLDKTKNLDENLPSDLEEFLRKKSDGETTADPVPKDAVTSSFPGSVRKASEFSDISYDAEELVQQVSKQQLADGKLFIDASNKEQKPKHKNDPVGVESMKMMKVRAALEAKLRNKGIFSTLAPKPDSRKNQKLMNGHLETYDDFDDDAVMAEKDQHGLRNGNASSIKLSQLLPTKLNKPKVISGDDDLPKRDDIGERRRKHELRVLAGAGVKSEDDAGNEPSTGYESEEIGEAGRRIDEDGEESEESDDDFYAQVKQKRVEKVSVKAEMYRRTAAVPSLPETVDGKRLISHKIEKNRGLTRPRNKMTKNPRKKYRTKHTKAQVRRKGQVRDIKKPYGPYGGETSGINAAISRSIRF